MGIVVITIAGASKLAFANALHKKTHGGVKLVVVQKPRRVSLRNRFNRTKKMLRDGTFLREVLYAILLYLSPKARSTLAYFREISCSLNEKKDNLPKVLEVDSVNSDEVYAELKKISPKLIVIWGSKILRPRVLETAKCSINLHIGKCPHYRGTLANQHAVLDGDLSNIGATIHYVAPEVDSGDMISVIEADLSKPPEKLFRDLIKKAQKSYLEIAVRLFNGEQIRGKKQSTKIGKMMLLKQWTPEVRYKVARRVLKWEHGRITNTKNAKNTNMALVN